MGDYRVAKRLTRFLVSEDVIDDFVRVRQWVSYGDESYHFPFDIEVDFRSLIKTNSGLLMQHPEN